MTRNIRLLYIHNFFNWLRFQLPFLVIYFADIAGSYTAAMGILAITTVTAAVADIPTGMLSDKMGRKFTLALGSCLGVIGLGFYAAAHGSAALCAGAFFSGLSQCLFNGNNNAMLYESLREAGEQKRYHYYLGRTGSMSQLALGLSALAASFMTGHGLRFLFIAGLVPRLVTVIVSLLFEEPRRHQAQERSFAHFIAACRKIGRNPRLLLMMAGNAISYGGTEAGFDFQSPFVNSVWPLWAVGAFRGAMGVIGFISQWLSGPVIERFNEAVVVTFRESFRFLSMTLAMIINNVFSPFLFLVNTFFFGPASVAREHLMQREFTDAQRATMASVASSAGSVLYALAALAIGAVSDHYGLRMGVECGVVISALSLPFFIWLFRREF